jgi:tetratricopeptide (TPR) repeat protein
MQEEGPTIDASWGETGQRAAAQLNNLMVDRLLRKELPGAEAAAGAILDRVGEQYLKPVDRAVALPVLHTALAGQHRYAEAAEAGEKSVEAYHRAANLTEDADLRDSYLRSARRESLELAGTWSEAREHDRAIRVLQTLWDEATTADALRDPAVADFRFTVLIRCSKRCKTGGEFS